MRRLGLLLLSVLLLTSPVMARSQMIASSASFPVASGTTNQKVTHIRKLADGTTITNVTTNIATRSWSKAANLGNRANRSYTGTI